MALKYSCLPGPVRKYFINDFSQEFFIARLSYKYILYIPLFFQVNAQERKKAEEGLANSGANHYMALYKQNKYKGLYEIEAVEEIIRISKIHGIGPKGNFQ